MSNKLRKKSKRLLKKRTKISGGGKKKYTLKRLNNKHKKTKRINKRKINKKSKIKGGKPKEGKLIDIATEPTSTDVPPLISHTPPPLRFLGDDFIIDPTIADDWDIIQRSELPEDTPETPETPSQQFTCEECNTCEITMNKQVPWWKGRDRVRTFRIVLADDGGINYPVGNSEKQIDWDVIESAEVSDEPGIIIKTNTGRDYVLNVRGKCKEECTENPQKLQFFVDCINRNKQIHETRKMTMEFGAKNINDPSQPYSELYGWENKPESDDITDMTDMTDEEAEQELQRLQALQDEETKNIDQELQRLQASQDEEYKKIDQELDESPFVSPVIEEDTTDVEEDSPVIEEETTDVEEDAGESSILDLAMQGKVEDPADVIVPVSQAPDLTSFFEKDLPDNKEELDEHIKTIENLHELEDQLQELEEHIETLKSKKEEKTKQLKLLRSKEKRYAEQGKQLEKSHKRKFKDFLILKKSHDNKIKKLQKNKEEIHSIMHDLIN